MYIFLVPLCNVYFLQILLQLKHFVYLNLKFLIINIFEFSLCNIIAVLICVTSTLLS